MSNIVANAIIVIGWNIKEDYPTSFMIPMIKNMRFEEFDEQLEYALNKYYYLYRNIPDHEINRNINDLKMSKFNKIYIANANYPISLDFIKGYSPMLDDHVIKYESIYDFYTAWT